MKALLVYPSIPDTFWSFKHILKFIHKRAAHVPLGLLTVGAMMPRDWELRLIDMNVEALTDEWIRWADMVFIGAMVVQKESVREVVGRCRSMGKTTIAGGPLFTSCAEDYSEIDHLVLNEAEITLPMFLKDLEAGNPRRIYSYRRKAGHHNHPPAQVGPYQHEVLRFHVCAVFKGLPF